MAQSIWEFLAAFNAAFTSKAASHESRVGRHSHKNVTHRYSFFFVPHSCRAQIRNIGVVANIFFHVADFFIFVFSFLRELFVAKCVSLGSQGSSPSVNTMLNMFILLKAFEMSLEKRKTYEKKTTRYLTHWQKYQPYAYAKLCVALRYDDVIDLYVCRRGHKRKSKAF